MEGAAAQWAALYDSYRALCLTAQSLCCDESSGLVARCCKFDVHAMLCWLHTSDLTPDCRVLVALCNAPLEERQASVHTILLWRSSAQHVPRSAAFQYSAALQVSCWALCDSSRSSRVQIRHLQAAAAGVGCKWWAQAAVSMCMSVFWQPP